MATPKRAVVLRLAELEKYPTTRARYEITLPFRINGFTFQDLRCNCPRRRPDGRYNFKCQGSCDVSISFAKLKEKAIRQTEKRWVWFSEARKLDDRLNRRLGTLGYLPFEIREMIWSLVIDDYIVIAEERSECPHSLTWEDREHGIHWTPLNKPLNFSFEIPHESDTYRRRRKSIRLDIFDLVHYFESDRMDRSAMYLRSVSPQAKIELENTFIYTNAFEFRCPIALGHFLDQLPAHQRPLLRAVNLGLFGCYESYNSPLSPRYKDSGYEGRAWVAVIERLPATVKTVTFELVHYGLDLTFLDGWTPPRFKNLNIAVALLEIMTKKVRRQAPRADIILAGLDKMRGQGRDIIQSMLDEVEPFSEDFKEWSDESRKNATE